MKTAIMISARIDIETEKLKKFQKETDEKTGGNIDASDLFMFAIEHEASKVDSNFKSDIKIWTE